MIGTPTVTQFSYCSVGDPGAASATIRFTQAVTSIVDCAKNWVVNEHVGKLVQFSNNALLADRTDDVIRSQISYYLNLDIGCYCSSKWTLSYELCRLNLSGTGARRGPYRGGTEGFATGGSTTTLIDTTKVWEVNSWAKVVGRKRRIVEGDGSRK